MELIYHLDQEEVSRNLSEGIYHFYKTLHKKQNQPILVLCIGTDRSTGDSLGPLVGTFLEEMPGKRFKVLGSLNKPVHATNIEEARREINRFLPDPFIVSVDAGLGKRQNIGEILVKNGPLYPGSGVDKKLPPVGHMHLTGLVNVGGYMEYFVLQSTRLSLVFKMARTIAESLYLATNKYLHEINPVSFSKLV